MSSDDSDLTPEYIKSEAIGIANNLLPEKSKESYMKAYDDFNNWKTTKGVRDLTAVKVLTGEGGARRTVILSSAYLLFEKADPVSKEIRELVTCAGRENQDIIIGCDANAHHVIWGSSDTNERGEKLLEYLDTDDLFNFIPNNQESNRLKRTKNTKALTVIKRPAQGTKLVRVEIHDIDNFDNIDQSICICNADICAQKVIKNIFMDEIYKLTRELVVKIQESIDVFN